MKQYQSADFIINGKSTTHVFLVMNSFEIHYW